MVRRQLPAEQLPSNDVHVHPVAASLADARATAVAAAVAAAEGSTTHPAAAVGATLCEPNEVRLHAQIRLGLHARPLA